MDEQQKFQEEQEKYNKSKPAAEEGNDLQKVEKLEILDI